MPIIASAHLIFVVLGCYQVQLFPIGSHLHSLKSVYQSYTGSDAGYDFFAPEVSTQLRVIFNATSSTGTREVTLHSDNREAGLRLGNIVNYFWSPQFNQDERRALVASWSSAVFAKYPSTTKVDVNIQRFILPSMTEYRSGADSYWEDYYHATFRKDYGK
jgi:hypothetical protein